MEKFWKVVAYRGHAGSGNIHSLITFAIKAPNAIKASDIARKMPGVKHSRPVAACEEIRQEDYEEMRQTSAYAAYQK